MPRWLSCKTTLFTLHQRGLITIYISCRSWTKGDIWKEWMTWDDIKDGQFIIINGQHNVATSRHIIGYKDINHHWEKKWRFGRAQLSGPRINIIICLFYILNNSNSFNKFTPTWTTQIKYCRRVWVKPRRPKKNGYTLLGERSTQKWRRLVKYVYPMQCRLSSVIFGRGVLGSVYCRSTMVPGTQGNLSLDNCFGLTQLYCSYGFHLYINSQTSGNISECPTILIPVSNQKSTPYKEVDNKRTSHVLYVNFLTYTNIFSRHKVFLCMSNVGSFILALRREPQAVV